MLQKISFGLVLILSLFLVGCDSGPEIDGTNMQTFEQSVESMYNNASHENQEKIKFATEALMMQEVENYFVEVEGGSGYSNVARTLVMGPGHEDSRRKVEANFLERVDGMTVEDLVAVAEDPQYDKFDKYIK